MHRSPILLPTSLFLAAVLSAAQSPDSAAPQSAPSPSGLQAQQPPTQAPTPASSIPDSATGNTGATSRQSPAVSGDPAPGKTTRADRNKQSNAAEPESTQPSPPQQPKTEILDTSSTSAAMTTDGHDPILDPPAFPMGSTTVVGGIISSVDRIRNHLTVAIFGGGSWTVYFDERTHIFRNGAEATQLALKKGDRVYVDTMLDNNRRDIFARNIRVGLVTPPADAAGQILEVDGRHQQLVLRDTISSGSVRFAVDNNTRISRGSQPATFQDVKPGSLVRVQFAPDRPGRGLAREIKILALPGSVFKFAGTVTFLDTHRSMLSVHNAVDDKTYDIQYIPSRANTSGPLAVGEQVQVLAMFDGSHYTAQQITVTTGPAK